MGRGLGLVAAVALVAVIGVVGLTVQNPRTSGTGEMPSAMPTPGSTPLRPDATRHVRRFQMGRLAYRRRDRHRDVDQVQLKSIHVRDRSSR